MAVAEAIDAPQDCEAASQILSKAREHLDSSRIVGVDPEGAYGLCYDAARKACDAVLRSAGRRLTSGLSHHKVFIAEARRLLGEESQDLMDSVEVGRQVRNRVQYGTREVSQTELDGLRDAAAKLVALAAAYVSDHCG